MKANKIICPEQDYEAPMVVCIDIEHEGVLCSSSEDLEIDDSLGDIFN